MQEPRYRPSIKKRSPHVDDCAFLATAYGLTPDPWQIIVLTCWLAVDKAGRFLAGRCGLAVPRQNGKNAVLEMVELYKMVVLGRKILHTAHEVKTARKAFIRLKGFFENERQWPELARLVKEIRSTNGQEAIILHTQDCGAVASGSKSDCNCQGGGSCEFIARSRGSGRGFTVDDLVCDEAQELTDEQLEALLPTISSAPSGDPQQIYTGTPPSPGSPGTVFRRMRDAGIARKDPRLAWVEWSVSEIGDVFDRHRVATTNPALGLRLQMAVIDDELGQLTPAGYARERLGWWADESQASKPIVSASEWDKLAVLKSPGGPPCFGVRFSLDGSRLSLSAAVLSGDRVHVESIAQLDAVSPMMEGQPLATWLASAVRDAAGVVIDGKSGSGALHAKLLALKVPAAKIVTLNVSDVITAHSQILTSIKDATLSHIGQAELNANVAVAGRRDIGTDGGWGWRAIGDGDVLDLESVTLAAFGARSKTASPTRAPRRLR